MLKSPDILSEECEKFYLKSLAGMLAFPKKMANDIKEAYYYNKELFLNYNHSEMNEFINIDLSDLPASYHPEELSHIAKEISNGINTIHIIFIFNKNKDNCRGGFSVYDMSIELLVNIDPDNIDKNDLTMESYIEHELMHFVQFLLQRYRHGLNKPPKMVSIPELNELAGYPFKKSPKEYEKLQSKIDDENLSPEKRYETLYNLSPIEFYPKLNDAKDRFLSKDYLTNRTFKIFVGLIGNNPDYFFKYLKNNDHKLWSKAIKELWKLVEETIYY